MSEERPLGREDFRRLMSHSPSTECAQLCEEYRNLTERWIIAETEEELAKLAVLIRAVATRMQLLHCPDCLIF
jgi:hypothetical protein